MAEAKKDEQEILVFISNRDSVCGECGSKLGKHAWIRLAGENGAVCLACADLDHLAFLPAGNVAITRRSKKYSGLSAVVLQWSKSRKRYERQGILVEEAALAKAEEESLADAEVRERRRERASSQRESEDRKFIQRFIERLRELFPGMPEGREELIAAHACEKYSGRVGRSSSAKDLDEEAVRLAVIAHIRHVATNYDMLLMAGSDRQDARSKVRDKVATVLEQWEQKAAPIPQRKAKA